MARQKAADLAKFARVQRPKPLYEQLAALISQKVASGELAPGERLPREVDLAASLGVGRPSLREALKILQALGVVSIRHGNGVYVTPAGPDEIVRRLTPPGALPPERLRDLFEARKVLECQAAAWAAQRASEEAISDLGRLVAQMTRLLEALGAEGSPAAIDELAALDKAFHYRLTLSAGNAALTGLMGTMTEMIASTMPYSLAIPGRPMQSVYDHRRIFQAVAAHKPVAAARAMFSHIDSVERGVFRMREKGGESAEPPTERESDRDTLLVLTYREDTT